MLPSQCLAPRRVRRLTYRVYQGARVYQRKQLPPLDTTLLSKTSQQSRAEVALPLVHPLPDGGRCRRITVTSRQVGLQAKRTTNMIQRDQKIMTSLQAILLYTYFLAGSYVFKGAKQLAHQPCHPISLLISCLCRK